MDHPPTTRNPDYLEGWKEVAVYLTRSVRTVQRWEHTHGLPVHRVAGSIDVVWASKAELDAWKRRGTRPGVPEESKERDEAVAGRGRFRVGWRTAVMASTVLLALGLASAGYIATHLGSAEDGDAVFDTKPLPLHWQAGGEQRSQQGLADGRIIDPGFITFGPRSIVFEYVRQAAKHAALPYSFAALPHSLISPRLRFVYVPHENGRVGHRLGFMEGGVAPMTSCDNRLPCFGPTNGIGLCIKRTNAAYVTSRLAISRFADGRETELQYRMLSFQLNPGGRYVCTLTLEGTWATATISDGRHIEELKAEAEPMVPERVFATGTESIGFMAPPGRYAMGFKEIEVRDAVFRVGLSLAVRDATGEMRSSVEPVRSWVPTIRVGIHSNTNVDATFLNETSVRLNGIGARPGGSEQGFACAQANDVNGDGLRDLVCEFNTRELNLKPGPRELTLEGSTVTGRRFRGHLPIDGTR